MPSLSSLQAVTHPELLGGESPRLVQPTGDSVHSSSYLGMEVPEDAAPMLKIDSCVEGWTDKLTHDSCAEGWTDKLTCGMSGKAGHIALKRNLKEEDTFRPGRLRARLSLISWLSLNYPTLIICFCLCPSISVTVRQNNGIDYCHRPICSHQCRN